jgi:AcrR family transcriptional regulator
MTLRARVKSKAKKRNRPAKQKALLFAAAQLFASRGYESTTTREIARRAGCAEGLIHRYFGGKAGLLSTLLQQHYSSYGEDQVNAHPVHDSLEKSVRAFVEKQMKHLWEERDLLRVTMSRAMLEPKVGRLLVNPAPNRHAKNLVQLLKRHPKCRVAPRKHLQAAAHAIVTLTFDMGFLRPSVLGADRAACREVAHSASIMLIRGLTTES